MTEGETTKLRTWLKTRGYAKRTGDEICNTVKAFEEYCDEQNINPSHIRIVEAEGYREYRSLEKHRAVTTINKELSFLCTYFDFRVFYRVNISNPFRAVEKMKEAKRLPKGILTIAEVARLFELIELETHEDVFFYTCVHLLYATGMRINELESLRLENIHLDNGYLSFTDPKAKSERVIPLPEYTLSVLELYLTHADTETFFKRGKKRTINRWINDRLKRVCEKNELPHITCHSFRHTLATHLLKAGADIRQVQEFLGHRRLKNTEVYTHIFPEELLSVIEENHPREKLLLED